MVLSSLWLLVYNYIYIYGYLFMVVYGYLWFCNILYSIQDNDDQPLALNGASLIYHFVYIRPLGSWNWCYLLIC